MLTLKYEMEETYRHIRDNLDMQDPRAYQPVNMYFNWEFPFTDKESYLKFRQEWKEDYAKISDNIRESRKELKNKAREQAGHSKEVYYDLWDEESKLMGLQEEARKYMAALDAAKKEAARQMEEERKAA